MNRTERSLWERLNGCLPGVSDRVENAAGTGFPDVYGDCEKNSYWVELKVSPEKRALDKRRALELLRPSQVVWLHRHVREGAVAFVAVGHPRGLVVYRVVYRDRRIELEKIISLIGAFNTENKLYFISEMRRSLQHV